MISFTGHDGSKPVTSSMSLDPESTTAVLEGSAPVTPHMSAEKSSSTELVDCQLRVGGKKLLPSVIPGRAPFFVCEKQYEPILRRRTKRVQKVIPKNRRTRGPRGRFISTKGRKGKTNGGISQAPSSPATDFYGPFVATNEDEEHVGEDAYDSILNLKAPDCTEILRIMMGDRYYTEVSEEFRNTASLESPEFSTLLTTMNNAAYDEAADDGYYCVDKVKLKLSGWL